MRIPGLAIALTAVFLLLRCGGGTTEEDGDVTQDPDVAEDHAQDVAHDEITDAPQDQPAEDAPQENPADQPADHPPDSPPDTPTDELTCPPPPDCDPPLVLGIVNVIDENGCVAGYCCTGMSVEIPQASVISRFTVQLTGVAGVANIGETSIITGSITCEVQDPVDGSVVATCDEIPLFSGSSLDAGASQSVDLTADCTLSGTEPCEQDVTLVCAFAWSTIGCYSDGTGTVTITTQYHCLD